MAVEPVRLLCVALAFASILSAQAPPRPLRVVMYPFIPEYKSVELDVKLKFEAAHPDIRILFVDLSSNYYSPSAPDYIGNTKADIYELDSVFLQDFVKAGKVQPAPAGALLPEKDLLTNADAGSKSGNLRYGAAHWVCGNFLFFRAGDSSISSVKSLSDLESAIGAKHDVHKGLLTDLKGKSTLGEFYLETAVDHFGSAQVSYSHLSTVEPALKNNLARLANLCDQGFCRNQDFHDNKPAIYARQFDRAGGRALIGYSESLHSALQEYNDSCAPQEQCLSDADIDVIQFASDDSGRHQISWVDSFVVDADCKNQCVQDAVAFISFMNTTDTYKQILLNEGSAPAYLLPAKASLYSDPDLLKVAHLYPKLRVIIESAEVPSAMGLNDMLRNDGKILDSQLP